MEYCREAVVESITVPLRLGHSCRHIQPLHAFDFNMYSWEAGQVRYLSVALRPPRLYIIAVGLEQLGELQLSGPALALGCFTRWDHPA